VRATAVDAACFRSGAVVPAGLVNASEGVIQTMKIAWPVKIELKDLSSDTMLDDPHLLVQT
jgi:hypothetical protein